MDGENYNNNKFIFVYKRTMIYEKCAEIFNWMSILQSFQWIIDHKECLDAWVIIYSELRKQSKN